jgi:hypothetical protein
LVGSPLHPSKTCVWLLFAGRRVPQSPVP